MSLAARVGRAIFWGQAGRLLEAAVFFLFSLLLARLLGPASYGLYALGVSFAGVCVFFALLGLGPETLGRFLPEFVSDGRRDRAHRLLVKLLAARGAAILLVAGAVIFFRQALGTRLQLPLLSASLALVLLVFAARSIHDLLTYFSSALLDLRRVAAAKLAAALAAPLLFCILWLRYGAGVNGAWLAMIGGSLAGILVLAIPLLSVRSKSGGQDALPLGCILRFGMFTWVANFFLYILGDNMDVLLLGWLVHDRAAIGRYAVVAKIPFSVTGLLLGWAPLVAVASSAVAWQQGGIARLASLVEAQWKLAVLCLVGPLFLLVRYAPEIIAVFYSSAYAPSASVVRIMAGLLACAAIFGFSIQGGILYALNRERLACALVGTSAVFNIASEVFLVRRLGINGAAWATGLSFVLLAVLFKVAGAACAPLRFPLPFIGKVVFASLLAAVSTLWLHPASLFALGAGCALYAAVFFGSLAVMKPLNEQDSASLCRVNGLLGGWAEKFFAGTGATVGER